MTCRTILIAGAAAAALQAPAIAQSFEVPAYTVDCGGGRRLKPARVEAKPKPESQLNAAHNRCHHSGQIRDFQWALDIEIEKTNRNRLCQTIRAKDCQSDK